MSVERPNDTITLCVPFEHKDVAKAAGARWSTEARAWTCHSDLLHTDAYAQLRPFVPRMYRPDVAPPYIRPWMVPQTAWGKNLRSLLEPEEWDIVRRKAYAAAGARCRICGGRGPKWPVEADEGWHYDDVSRVQTLKGVIALCPDCHAIRHWGKTMVGGGELAAFQRLMRINRWSSEEARAAVDAAFEEWERRSRHEWTIDCTWVTRVHGMSIGEKGLERAARSHEALVDAAWAHADEDPIQHLFLGVTRISQPKLRPPQTTPSTEPTYAPPPPPLTQSGLINWLKAAFKRPGSGSF